MSDEEVQSESSRKREHDEAKNSSEDEGWVGPLPSEAVPVKKRKGTSSKRDSNSFNEFIIFYSILVLEFEKLYLENLPDAECYEKSYMHRDVVSHVVCTKSDFVITASVDGHVKFWKKTEEGIEFVKHFRAHLGKNHRS